MDKDQPRTVHADRPSWGVYDETLDPREWGGEEDKREHKTVPGKKAAMR